MTTATSVSAGLRNLLWGRGVSALGDGLWFTIWAVYFVRVVGLPAPAVGIGMGVAAACGLAAAAPLGAFADRHDPRAVLVAITVVRGLAMGGYLLVHGTWSFVLVTIAFTAFANGGAAVRTALVAGLVDGTAARVRVLAGQRVAQHVGYAIGAGAGALVLAADRPWAYLVAIAGNAATYLVLAVVTGMVPRPRSHPGAPRIGGLRLALRDRPYVAVMACTSMLALCWAMLSTGLPIWISGSTHLPLSLSGVVVVISSIGIAALQVPTTRLAGTIPTAARTAVVSGAALAAACLLLATTGNGAGSVAVALVVAAALLHLCGELGFVAASWTLSVSLMREEARGAYQGVSVSATATVQMFGPALFTTSLGLLGSGGWLLVAALFLAASLPIPALTRWAARTRPAADLGAPAGRGNDKRLDSRDRASSL